MESKSIVALICMLSVLGCRPKKKSKASDDYIQSQILDAVPPHLNTTTNATLGDVLVYRGNKVDTAVLRPGGPIAISHFWEVLKTPAKGTRLLTQVSSENGQWFNHDQSQLRNSLPIDRWPVGKIIRDRQHFDLQSDWMAQRAEVSVGAYKTNSDERLEWGASMAKDDSTLSVYAFTVDLSANDNPNGYIIRKTASKLNIDGMANETIWKSVVQSPTFQSVDVDASELPATYGRILYDETYLYLYVQLEGDSLKEKASSSKDDAVVLWCKSEWLDSDVVKNVANNNDWFVLKISKDNEKHLGWVQDTTQQTEGKSPVEQLLTSVTFNTLGDNRVVSKVATQEADHGGDSFGWNVEVAIPLDLIQKQKSKGGGPIPNGARFNLNLMRMDRTPQGKSRMSSWLPISKENMTASVLGVMADEEGRVNPKEKIDPGFK